MANLDWLMMSDDDDIHDNLESVLMTSILDHITEEYGEYEASYYEDEVAEIVELMAGCMVWAAEEYGLDFYSETLRDDLAYGAYYCAYDAYYELFIEDYYYGEFGQVAWDLSHSVRDDILANMWTLMNAEDMTAALEDIVYESIYEELEYEFGYYADYFSDYIEELSDGIAACLMEFGEVYGFDIYDEYFDEMLQVGTFYCAMDTYYDVYEYSADYYADMFLGSVGCRCRRHHEQPH